MRNEIFYPSGKFKHRIMLYTQNLNTLKHIKNRSEIIIRDVLIVNFFKKIFLLILLSYSINLHSSCLKKF